MSKITIRLKTAKLPTPADSSTGASTTNYLQQHTDDVIGSANSRPRLLSGNVALAFPGDDDEGDTPRKIVSLSPQPVPVASSTTGASQLVGWMSAPRIPLPPPHEAPVPQAAFPRFGPSARPPSGNGQARTLERQSTSPLEHLPGQNGSIGGRRSKRPDDDVDRPFGSRDNFLFDLNESRLTTEWRSGGVARANHDQTSAADSNNDAKMNSGVGSTASNSLLASSGRRDSPSPGSNDKIYRSSRERRSNRRAKHRSRSDDSRDSDHRRSSHRHHRRRRRSSDSSGSDNDESGGGRHRSRSGDGGRRRHSSHAKEDQPRPPKRRRRNDDEDGGDSHRRRRPPHSDVEDGGDEDGSRQRRRHRRDSGDDGDMETDGGGGRGSRSRRHRTAGDSDGDSSRHRQNSGTDDVVRSSRRRSVTPPPADDDGDNLASWLETAASAPYDASAVTMRLDLTRPHKRKHEDGEPAQDNRPLPWSSPPEHHGAPRRHGDLPTGVDFSVPPPAILPVPSVVGVGDYAAEQRAPKRTERFTLFFTKKYVFSNHRACENLTIDGRKFTCTEQYYMWCKAMTFQDFETAEEMLKTDDPKAMKRLGSNVKGFEQDKWDAPSRTAMVLANTHKYTQNEEMRWELFLTYGTELVECNPTDARWGIGLPMTDPRALCRDTWQGQNWLGQILTGIRKKMWKMDRYREQVDRAKDALRRRHRTGR